jgi:hydroxyethylthiazole kinase
VIVQDIQRIREEAPLILNITNYVVMNSTANALLALGASPVMAHAIEEIEDLVDVARALVINIGTLSAPWVESMRQAGRRARERGIPVVIDPVGCGATRYRAETARMLVAEIRPAVVRGNASEIRALERSARAGKGVDSSDRPDDVCGEARAVSRSAGCAVSVSGAVDVIVQDDRIARIDNGHPMMTRVTGMGCTASALTGAFLAVRKDPFVAAMHAMTVMGVAGEIAALHSAGPGSLQVNFLDVLHALDPDETLRRGRVRLG